MTLVHKLRSLFGAQDMTIGSPISCLLKFSIPLLLGNLAQQMYNTVDAMVIGQSGSGWLGRPHRESAAGAFHGHFHRRFHPVCPVFRCEGSPYPEPLRGRGAVPDRGVRRDHDGSRLLPVPLADRPDHPAYARGR